jgi:hypothetical protein
MYLNVTCASCRQGTHNRFITASFGSLTVPFTLILLVVIETWGPVFAQAPGPELFDFSRKNG